MRRRPHIATKAERLEGQKITFARRYAEGRMELLPSLAAELVGLRPDVVFAIGTPAARAAKASTQTIPIILARISDPIGSGLVSGLARPGGNLIGLTVQTRELAAKRLHLLIAAVPDAKRGAALWDPNFPPGDPLLKEIETAAPSLKLEPFTVGATGPDDFEQALRATISEPLPRSDGNDWSGRRANRQDHKGDQSGRHSGRADDALRAGYKPEYRPFAESCHSANIARPRRRGDRLTRRDFTALLGAAAVAWSLAAGAQQTGKEPRIGVLAPGPPEPYPEFDAFYQGLRELGYTEGQNIAIERVYAGWKPDRFPQVAAELVRRKVDVIVVASTSPARAAKEATSTIPIVVAGMADPVGDELVVSLARPGGNITGNTFLGPELIGKRFGLLKRPFPDCLAWLCSGIRAPMAKPRWHAY
jgi:ABC-type uncharacterized transport system substrate-binding protein